jgi:uncharacterized sulfatase
MDLVPSLLKIADVAAPADVSFDGEDISDTLLGRLKKSRQAPIYFRRPPDRKSFRKYKDLPDLAVRMGEWKFLCDLGGRNPQLYHLNQDPGESTNLIERYPELTERLTRDVLNWNATMPVDGVAAPQAKAPAAP